MAESGISIVGRALRLLKEVRLGLLDLSFRAVAGGDAMFTVGEPEGFRPSPERLSGFMKVV